MTTTETLRKQVRKYISTADEDSLRRVNAILEIDQSRYEWWKDKEFVAELDSIDAAMESGEEKGVTMEELKISIEKIRKDMYGE